MEYGFRYVIMRSPYTPYSTYLRGTIDAWVDRSVHPLAWKKAVHLYCPAQRGGLKYSKKLPLHLDSRPCLVVMMFEYAFQRSGGQETVFSNITWRPRQL